MAHFWTVADHLTSHYEDIAKFSWGECNRVDISIASKILKHAIRKYNISKCEYTIEYNTSPRIYQFLSL